ncbi:MAG: carboxypeptidase-like regulatory domain-containing protein [Flavobacteriales bacterium]|nr:carboxypeptidase-like regulatory domain-containing protein [Flavobacteriales bacterium]
MKKNSLLFLLLFATVFHFSKAQTTRVKGKVVNENNEPMPFVNIKFKNSNVGTITDFDGKYSLETKWATDNLSASFIGYTTSTKTIEYNKPQTINFKLQSTSIKLAAVNIVEKKKLKYKNKGNPAVDLARMVIKNKDINQKHKLDYYEYSKYEKEEFDLNNFSEKIAEKKIMKNFQFVFENYVDTSEVNGKPFIPFFIRETLSKVFFRKNPETKKEILHGTKMSGSLNRMDNDGIGHIMQKLYSEIDIYQNQIELFGNQFPSPINDVGPVIYKYFIIDTVNVEGISCINLGFSPRSKTDFAFSGNMFVVNDSSYAVRKLEMGINKNINLNFVNDLKIEQNFKKVNNEIWMQSSNTIFIDYSFGERQTGIVGKKNTSFKDFVINKEAVDSIYSSRGDVIKSDQYKSTDFWQENRHEELNENEEGIYTMIDSIQNTKTFKIINETSSILTSGWINCNWYELGTVATFVSWNKIEGLKLRLGGRTTTVFNPKYQISGHIAMGLGDLRIKYLSGFNYSFNEDFLRFPQNRIYTSISRATQFPGQYSQSLDNDNFLHSFNSNASDKMILKHNFHFDYLKEFQSGFSFNILFDNNRLIPLGELIFIDGLGKYDKHINTDEVSLKLRYAPKQQFYQTKNQRRILKNKHTIVSINHTQGFTGFFNGEYNFSKSSLELGKRSYIPLLGYSDIEVEVGKFWGTAPFPILQIPIANQSLGYQFKSFNLMNYLEFINDEYITIQWNHFSKGAIFNKLPLIKKLKVREVIGLKALVGSLSDKNNPNLHPELLQFPENSNGEKTTHLMNRTPYIEVSAGITNVFKFIRIDIIKRISYLHDKYQISSAFGVRGMGIKFSAKFDF